MRNYLENYLAPKAPLSPDCYYDEQIISESVSLVAASKTGDRGRKSTAGTIRESRDDLSVQSLRSASITIERETENHQLISHCVGRNAIIRLHHEAA